MSKSVRSRIEFIVSEWSAGRITSSTALTELADLASLLRLAGQEKLAIEVESAVSKIS